MFNHTKSNKKMKFINLANYYEVQNRQELNLLKEKVSHTLKNLDYPLVNNSTQIKVYINSKCLGKMLFPAPYFNPYQQDYILNLNALLEIKKIFNQAIYIDSYKELKNKNKDVIYHYFVAPIIINNLKYRIFITTYENMHSGIFYLLTTHIENIEISSLTISVIKLVQDIKLYNYKQQDYQIYDIEVMRNHKVIKERKELYNGFV